MAPGIELTSLKKTRSPWSQRKSMRAMPVRANARDIVSADWRMNIAYNAALQAATAALAASGYRASRDQHHFRIIQSLRETIGVSAEIVATFDAFRKKRNITGYERAGIVSDADAAEMRKLAITIRNDAVAWMRKTYPELVKRR